MRISESIRRKTLKIAGGVILNYFKIKRRRNTLYFGDIPARYFLLCEKNGFGEELRKIGQKWMYLYFSTMIPNSLKKLPPDDIINNIMRKIWANIGLMSDVHMERDGDCITIETKEEGMTELIGKNSFLLGFHEGIMNALYGREVETLEYRQAKNECYYLFKIKESGFRLEGKSKDEYNRLNHVQNMAGPNLDDMLKARVFTLAGNRMYFRGKIIYPIENTALHLFSNQGPMLEKVPGISHEFFMQILDRDSSEEDRIRLLKNIIQSMGWGTLSVSKGTKSVKMKIENPPYGLQKERDNWQFLINMIHGYMMTIDENYRIDTISQGYRLFNIGISK